MNATSGKQTPIQSRQHKTDAKAYLTGLKLAKFTAPSRKHCYGGIFLTFSRVLQHQALQFRPLCVEPLHQFVGVDWVGEVALWVRGGHSGQSVQFVGPAKRQDKPIK